MKAIKPQKKEAILEGMSYLLEVFKKTEKAVHRRNVKRYNDKKRNGF
jgi:hypothetical protein